MCGCVIDTSIGATADIHFLKASAWMGKIEQEAIGPPHVHNVPGGSPIEKGLSVKLIRCEGDSLSPHDGPGLGVDLNQDALKIRETEYNLCDYLNQISRAIEKPVPKLTWQRIYL
jgi:L-alanine-DL-glutamate epimerase-like enolase superfamily enzyme